MTEPQLEATEEEATPDPRIQRANAEAARYRVERNEARQQIEALQQQLAEAMQHLQEVQTTADQERLARLRMAAAFSRLHGRN